MPAAPRRGRAPTRVAGALVLLATAHACAPAPDPDLAFHRGRNALEEGEEAWARHYFAEDLRTHPDRAESWRLAGLAWTSGQGQGMSRAVEHFERYLELRPEDDEVRLLLARHLLGMGRRDRALALAEAAGESRDAWLLAAHLRLDDDPDAARTLVGRALAAEKGHEETSSTHAVAGLVEERLGHWDDALAHARRAASLDPLEPRVHYQIGRLWRRAGDVEASRRALEAHQILARLEAQGSLRPPSPVERLRLLGELSTATGSDAKPLRIRIVRALADTGRLDEARELLATIPTDPADALELGALAEAVGRQDVAAAGYRELCDGTAQVEDVARREACYRLARLALLQGRTDEAAERLGTALERDPWMARLHRLAARLAQERGDEDAETTALERALELSPWRTDDRLDLASRLLERGERRRAAALLDEAPEPDEEIDRYRRHHDLD